MAVAQPFANPLAGRILASPGAFPSGRGSNDEEALAAGQAILECEGLVMIYPKGGLRPALDSVLPRLDVEVLALTSGAPVVPAAIIDATTLHKAGFLKLPEITVRSGDLQPVLAESNVAPELAERKRWRSGQT